jgi:hypothetical protein
MGAAHVRHQPPAGGCGLAASPVAAEYAHGTYAALPFPNPPHLSSGVRNACVAWRGVSGSELPALQYYCYNTTHPKLGIGEASGIPRRSRRIMPVQSAIGGL